MDDDKANYEDLDNNVEDIDPELYHWLINYQW